MVSPFIGGGTLAGRLRRGPWTVDEALAVLEPLAAALDYAHGEGLVHRDVKPSNVLFTERGRLILSDFGIARMLEGEHPDDPGRAGHRNADVHVAEQAEGQRAGPASDLYSLGVVAYEMLTGRPPFIGETPLALLRAHVDQPLPPPRALNPACPSRSRRSCSGSWRRTRRSVSVGRCVRDGAPLATTYRSRLMAPPADLHTPTRIMETDERQQRAARRGAPGRRAWSTRRRSCRMRPRPAPRRPTRPVPGPIAPTAALPTVPAPPIPAGPTRRGSGTPAQRPTDPDETRLLPARRFSRRQVVVGLGALTVAGVGPACSCWRRERWSQRSRRGRRAAVPSAPAPATSEAPAVAALPSPTAAPLTSAPPSPSPVVADASPVLRRTMPIENDTGLYLSTMALSPDGQVLATGSTNGLISLWRVDDGSGSGRSTGLLATRPRPRFSRSGSPQMDRFLPPARARASRSGTSPAAGPSAGSTARLSAPAATRRRWRSPRTASCR